MTLPKDIVDSIIADVLAERERQDRKWGEQDLPSVDVRLIEHTRRSMSEIGAALMLAYGMPTEADAKARCDQAMAEHRCTHAHVVIEELCEAMEACVSGDEKSAETELVQLTACLFKWLQQIRKRKAKGMINCL